MVFSPPPGKFDKKRPLEPNDLQNKDLCGHRILDLKKVKILRQGNLPKVQVQRASEIFRALGDPHRAKILYFLSQEELCVCDLAAVVGLSESATSHHLRILRNLHLVRFNKKGKTVLYRLDDHHVSNLIKIGLDHAKENHESP